MSKFELPYVVVVNGKKMAKPSAINGMEAIANHFTKSTAPLKIKAYGLNIKLDHTAQRGGCGWVQLSQHYGDLKKFWGMLKYIGEAENKMCAEVGTKSYVTYAESGRYTRRTATADRIKALGLD